MFTKGKRIGLCVGVVGLVWLLRLCQIKNPLPPEWRPDEEIAVSMSIMQAPEYRDDYTLIKSGEWRIKLKGYQRVMPGSRIKVRGKAKVEERMGKVVTVVMTGETIERLGEDKDCLSCRVRLVLGLWRERWVLNLSRILPEPMASLAGGILLGVSSQMPSEFYQALTATGTLHVVAASGYNVTIVATILMKIAAVIVRRGLAIVIAILGIMTYVLIAGGSSSVVRAGIMGSLTLMAYFAGRPAEAKRLLWVAAGLMLLFQPLTLFDTGFQLSVGATYGLLYIEPKLRERAKRWDMALGKAVQATLSDYLYPTLAATIVTLPVIWWHFGRVSWISPLANMLILPVVPLIMLLAALSLVMTPLSLILGQSMGWLLYVPLAWMVEVIKLLGKL